MTFDELLASYDPIDIEYKKRFFNDCIPIRREINPKYTSFIPSKEEAEKILLLKSLSKLVEVQEKS